jgi:hypothetical protein
MILALYLEPAPATASNCLAMHPPERQKLRRTQQMLRLAQQREETSSTRLPFSYRGVFIKPKFTLFGYDGIGNATTSAKANVTVLAKGPTARGSFVCCQQG